MKLLARCGMVIAFFVLASQLPLRVYAGWYLLFDSAQHSMWWNVLNAVVYIALFPAVYRFAGAGADVKHLAVYFALALPGKVVLDWLASLLHGNSLNPVRWYFVFYINGLLFTLLLCALCFLVLGGRVFAPPTLRWARVVLYAVLIALAALLFSLFAVQYAELSAAATQYPSLVASYGMSASELQVYFGAWAGQAAHYALWISQPLLFALFQTNTQKKHPR